MLSAARIKLTPSLELLLKSQLEEAIEQANLGTLGTFVAKKYLIEQVQQIDIAEEIGYDRTFVTRRIKSYIPRIEHAAEVLFGNLHTTAS